MIIFNSRVKIVNPVLDYTNQVICKIYFSLP
jgi:hypothetical protein